MRRAPLRNSEETAVAPNAMAAICPKFRAKKALRSASDPACAACSWPEVPMMSTVMVRVVARTAISEP